MGRKAGHLALGIGKAAGATITLIPEEFGAGPIRLSRIVDLLEGSMIKRLANGREDGVAVLAEGLAELLDPSDLASIKDVERDPHGHIRLAEIPLGTILKRAVRERLASRGIKVTIVEKDVGYELRCASPIPFDEEYTRDLGHGAVRCLMDGQSGIMITRTESNMTPIPLAEIQDPKTGRTRVRVVDTDSDGYRVARTYQIRILPEDLRDEAKAKKIAEAGKTTVEDLRKRFSAAT
jgi:6-phosphofructokinase 1